MLRQIRWLKILLADDELTQFLGHKTAWLFSSPEVFLAVIERVPLFYQNARIIAFSFYHAGLCIALDKLTSCRGITRLSITFHFEVIDLDIMAPT
jgi:hypothetical protein